MKHIDFCRKDALVADGFDNAIVGVDMVDGRICYDYKLIIESLEREGMDRADAIDYFYFNILGAKFSDPIYPLYIQFVTEDTGFELEDLKIVHNTEKDYDESLLCVTLESYINLTETDTKNYIPMKFCKSADDEISN